MTRWPTLVLPIVMLGAAYAADDGVATYAATYRVEYKGKEAGTAEFSVRYLEKEGSYEFTSATTAKGLLKLARPNPAVDRSRFRVTGSGLEPLEFWYEDGSRSREDNFHVEFDWQRRVATVSAAAGRREMALPSGALDRGSVQVALMRDLAMTGTPGRYELADDEAVSTYEYLDEGTATLATTAGSYETRKLTQRRAGSSRATFLWMAPALSYLPVRIEQHRDGELQTAFELVKVTGLAPAGR